MCHLPFASHHHLTHSFSNMKRGAHYSTAMQHKSPNELEKITFNYTYISQPTFLFCAILHSDTFREYNTYIYRCNNNHNICRLTAFVTDNHNGNNWKKMKKNCICILMLFAVSETNFHIFIIIIIFAVAAFCAPFAPASFTFMFVCVFVPSFRWQTKTLACNWILNEFDCMESSRLSSERKAMRWASIKKKCPKKINLNSSFSPVLPSHIALMIFPWIRGNIDSAHSCGGDPRTHILSDASFFVSIATKYFRSPIPKI